MPELWGASARGAQARGKGEGENDVSNEQPWWEYGPEAREVKSLGFTPLEPYPGQIKAGWRMRHEVCGTEVRTALYRVRTTQHSGCRTCSAVRGPSQRVLDRLEELDLEPLDPYPGTKVPWRMRHRPCGREVTPMMKNLLYGNTGGCVLCYRDTQRKPLDAGLVALVSLVSAMERADAADIRRMTQSPQWAQVMAKVASLPPTGLSGDPVLVRVVRVGNADDQYPRAAVEIRVGDEVHTLEALVFPKDEKQTAQVGWQSPLGDLVPGKKAQILAATAVREVAAYGELAVRPPWVLSEPPEVPQEVRYTLVEMAWKDTDRLTATVEFFDSRRTDICVVHPRLDGIPVLEWEQGEEYVSFGRAGVAEGLRSEAARLMADDGSKLPLVLPFW